MNKLSDETQHSIQRLYAQADELAAQKKLCQAINLYWQAFDLLPQPSTQWEAAAWILASVGDANFQGQNYVAGSDNLTVAMSCPGGIGNPFPHLRLGQCEYELGNLDRAADELARAYMGAGAEVFQDEDSKYFDFLKTRLHEPSGGW